MLGLIFIALLLLIPISSNASAFNVSYPSIITIRMLPESVDRLYEPIPYDEPTYVLMELGYAVHVPEWILNSGPILRLWLFHRFYTPIVPITIVPEEVPTGVDVTVLTDVYITEISNDFVNCTFVISITPTIEIPSRHTTINLKASSESFGKITGTTYTNPVFFEVEK